MDWLPATLEAPWPERKGHSSVIFDNKMWVIGERFQFYGGKRDVWYSENGEDWLPAALEAAWCEREGATSVVHNDEIWVIGGSLYDESYPNHHHLLNDAWHSEEGASWSELVAEVRFGGRYLHSCTVFDGRVWIIGGFDGDSSLSDVWYMW